MDDRRRPGYRRESPDHRTGEWVVVGQEPADAYEAYEPYEPYEPSARPEQDGWAWRSGWYGPAEQPPPSRDGRPPAAQQYPDPPYGSPQQYGGQPSPGPYAREDPYARGGWYDRGPGQRYAEPAPEPRHAGYGEPRRPEGEGRYPPAPAEPVAPRPAAGSRARPSRPAPAPPPDEPPDDEGPDPSLPATLGFTISMFLAPLLIYLGSALSLLSGEARPGCVDAAGAPCPSPRAHAVQSLVDAAPALLVALMLALLLAVGIRRIAMTWRPYKIGFAAAAIGAGVVTLTVTALG